MSKLKPTPPQRGILLLLSALSAIASCNALDTTTDPLLADTDTPAAAVPEIERVTVIVHNQTTDPALVDIDLDAALVTYPVRPRQILSVRLKCADVFTFVSMRFAELGHDAPAIPVGYQAFKDIDYHCHDILLINIHEQNPELKVVLIDRPADQEL